MGKRLILLLATLAVSFAASAGHYKNFRNTAYIMAGDVNRIGTVENWEKSYAEFSKNLQLDKVYIETFRDMTYSDDKALEAAIQFFKSKGIEISGGITYNWRGGVRQRWESFCYSNPEHLAIIQGVIERTAALFDEIVLDDYYFTNCKVIVKYPNWYDHFYGLGFDLARGPWTFGGWVDTGGASYPDLFAEQLWLTLLSKGPEITLFNYSGMTRPFRSVDRPWASDNPTLDLEDLKAGSAKRGVSEPTWGRVAQYAYDKIDPILGKLGNPKGIPAYKPFNAEGEEFLHNYLGMAGLPMMCHCCPQLLVDSNVKYYKENG